MSNDKTPQISEIQNQKKRKREIYESIFEYGLTESKDKFAKCRKCSVLEKDCLIKMKDGNTTGTTRHLRKFHTDEFEKIQALSDSSHCQNVIILLIYLLNSVLLSFVL